MTTTPTISGREMFRIMRCLAVTCLLVGMVLGGVYYVTEPTAQRIQTQREATLVKTLLALDTSARIIEVRRYLTPGEQPRVAYLLPEALWQFTLDGTRQDSIAVTSDVAEASGHVRDAWVAEQLPRTTYVGRFFIAHGRAGEIVGYVTEASQYGFKSHIRFFVALTADFHIRGVEVVAHEEDPGLGADITRPIFQNQFAGRGAEALPYVKVTKDPMPRQWRELIRAREVKGYDEWSGMRMAEIAERGEHPIYAVTGATISSKALTDGVKRAVDHLQYRLSVIRRQSPVNADDRRPTTDD